MVSKAGRLGDFCLGFGKGRNTLPFLRSVRYGAFVSRERGCT
jgi:hypothetical protein